MISQRVRKAFELFANSEIKLISKQVNLEVALANIVDAAETMARRYESRDNDYIPSIRDIIDAEENFKASLAELEQALKDVGA